MQNCKREGEGGLSRKVRGVKLEGPTVLSDRLFECNNSKITELFMKKINIREFC